MTTCEAIPYHPLHISFPKQKMQESLQKMSRRRRGLYELNGDSLEPRLYNKDLAPTKIAERTWGTYDVAALWVGLSVNIPTYMLAAGLIEGA